MSREQSGGLSVTTLLIASGSAAAAAVIVPLFWDRGSLVAAAITPVIVTLTSEGLKKPVEKVQTVGVWRRTPQGTAVRQPHGRDFDPLDPEEERFEVDPEQTDDPFGLREPERGRLLHAPRVVLALVTGALAFGIAAVVVTASELAIFGDSVSRRAPHDVLRRQVQGRDADADRDADGHAGGGARRRPRRRRETPVGHADHRGRLRRPRRRPRRRRPARRRPPPPRRRVAGDADARRPRPLASGHGQGPDPDLTHLSHGSGDRPRGGPGRAPARHGDRQPGARRGGQAEGARAPPRRGRRSRSSPRSGR